MGWLRELLEVPGSRYRSYGELARAALEHPGWPKAETAPQARSLAALFSKLDRRIELEWLEQRAEVQRVLAELLGVGVHIVREATNGAAPEAGAARVRLRELRYARPLDLESEALPPGYPEAVLHPATWGALWWTAPSGAGRTLLGRWHEQRGTAQFARTWAGTREGRGPVFLELSTPLSGAQRPSGRPICVAAPFAPPAEQGWTVVESPPPAEWVPELVHWVARRLPADSELEVPLVEKWLLEELAPQGLVDGLGAALGLCGVADELGRRELRDRALPSLARKFVRKRSERVFEEAPELGTLLRRHGFELLVALVRQLLVSSDERWDAARSFEDWLDLIPAEHRLGPDVEWLKVALPEAGSVRASDVTRAAKKLPPGAHRILRALMAADLLRANDDDPHRLSLGPRWLGVVLVAEARERLLDGSPLEWGEALLRPHASAPVALGLEARARVDATSLVDSVLDLEGDEDPAVVVATETTFRAVGLAVLEGAEPPEGLAQLWEEQLRLMVELPEAIPRPRVPFPASGALWLSDGHWLLAALAVGERLLGAARFHPLLCPFQQSDPPQGLVAVYDAIGQAVADPSLPTSSWTLHAFELVDRLRRTVGLISGEELHRLERPGVALEELEVDCLRWDTLTDADPHELAALEWMARRRGASWSVVADAVWRSYAEAGFPDGPESDWLLETRSADPRFWAFVPAPLLAPLLHLRTKLGFGPPWPLLSRTHWEALLANLQTSVPTEDRVGALEAAPAEPLIAALLAGQLDQLPEQEQFCLWQRVRERVLERVAQCLAEDALDAAFRWLDSAPLGTTDAGARLLEQRLKRAHPEALVHPARRWLSERVRTRQGAWRQAFALLTRIERALERFPRAG